MVASLVTAPTIGFGGSPIGGEFPRRFLYSPRMTSPVQTRAPAKQAFIKMNGLGNDFAVVQAPFKSEGAFEPGRDQVRAWADRKNGIGFDQLILISGGGGEPLVRFWNCDGEEIGACGNGSRCVGWLLMEAKGRSPSGLPHQGTHHRRHAGGRQARHRRYGRSGSALG